MDELRESTARKGRSYESKTAELEDELQTALQGKRDAERKLLDVRDSAPARDRGELELRFYICMFKIRQRLRHGGKCLDTRYLDWDKCVDYCTRYLVWDKYRDIVPDTLSGANVLVIVPDALTGATVLVTPVASS